VTARLLVFGPLAIVVAPFLIWPALLGLVTSFTNYAPGQPAVRVVGLANYAAVLEDGQFRTAARNVTVSGRQRSAGRLPSCQAGLPHVERNHSGCVRLALAAIDERDDHRDQHHASRPLWRRVPG
jgi:hypothetical protein